MCLKSKLSLFKSTQRKQTNSEASIFCSFLVLYLADQHLRCKVEDLDKTDKRESHAESEHSSDVGDEGYGRHYLKKSKDSYLFLAIFFTTTI